MARASRLGCPDRSPLLTLTGTTVQWAPSELMAGPRLVAATKLLAAGRETAEHNTNQAMSAQFRQATARAPARGTIRGWMVAFGSVGAGASRCSLAKWFVIGSFIVAPV